MTQGVPGAVAELLAGRPAIGSREQAFPFLTVDVDGFPHVCLLSRNELDVAGDQIRAVIASRRTSANLDRSATATLIAVSGTTAHYLKLRVSSQNREHGVLTVVLAVTDHIADSLGFELAPISYVVPADLESLEIAQRRQRGDRT